MGSLNISSTPEVLETEVEQKLLSTSEEHQQQNNSSSRRWKPSPQQVAIFSCSMAVASFIVAVSAVVFAIFSCRNPSGNPNTVVERWGYARPLKKLSKPVVLLISSDGFRYGYQWKVPLPNINRLRSNGTEAVPGIIPVYPTLTFPNHYSIATGLYPGWHGIVANYFTDPASKELFHPGIIDPKWWLGEPIWETVVKNGLVSATYFWPGSDVTKGAWTCKLPYCQHYNTSVPYEDRVDTVLGYFDLPKDEMPSFITLYFEEPDLTGHHVGADDPHINQAIILVDQMIGKLLNGLESRGILDDVSIIFLGDHGMVGTCDKKVIYLEDLKPWINIPEEWTNSLSPVLAIRPPEDVDVKHVYQKISEGLSSGKVSNAEFLKVYLKEDIPARLHYSSSDRIPPIIGIVAEGYKVEMVKSKNKECAGAHGYDNEVLSMHPIFVAHGPQFARGRELPSFINVEIYNMIATILGIQGSPNNGTDAFARNIVLPSK